MAARLVQEVRVCFAHCNLREASSSGEAKEGVTAVGMAFLVDYLNVPLSWREIFKRTLYGALWNCNCLAMAAQLAYYLFSPSSRRYCSRSHWQVTFQSPH